MKWEIVLKVLGVLLTSIGFSMSFSFLWSIYFSDGQTRVWLISMLITMLVGFSLYLSGKYLSEKKNLSLDNVGEKESYFVVSFGWIIVSLFSSLPFYFSGEFGGFINSFFETVSGYTTTGASILTSIEDKSPSLLFWRSFTHFLGGMGIVVLAVAILPYLGIGGSQLFKQEVPGISVEKLTPRVQDTAKVLWFIYIGFTIIETILYKLAGMSLFDALNHSFATMATGGFSTKNASIAGFHSPIIEYITIVFMYLAGVNFTLHYFFLRTKKISSYFSSTEFKVYNLIIILSIIFVMLSIRESISISSWEDNFRLASFQVISILTTTGFATYDYLKWPVSVHVLLVILMFVGGMGGSTGGGMKVSRIIILLKQVKKEFARLLEPKKVHFIYFENKVIQMEIVIKVLTFAVIYFILLFAGTFIIALLGEDFTTAFGASIACLSNIGPGIGKVGPVYNYNFIHPIGKLVLAFLMIAGRLEIFTFLMLFNYRYWKN